MARTRCCLGIRLGRNQGEPAWRIGLLHVVACCCLGSIVGCASHGQLARMERAKKFTNELADQTVGAPATLALYSRPVYHQVPAENIEPRRHETTSDVHQLATPRSIESLSDLEALAVTSNPSLRRLRREAAAARARANHVGRLPDPTLGANFFTAPIETAAGSQRANVTLMQTLPSLKRLNAQTQQACLEALALEQIHEIERLKTIGDVRAAWYRRYVLSKQIETALANQRALKLLIDTAISILPLGRGSASDVQMGIVEYSRLEERLLKLKQQLASNRAELNRLAGRRADIPIQVPRQLDVSLPNWSHEMLRQLALENQPAIASARIRAEAAQWGVEVARLNRRPDITFNASWFAIDDNRPASTIVVIGEDAWSVGGHVTIPLWRGKYEAMHREANWKHAAAQASIQEAMQAYDSLVSDLWEQAQAASETARLYRDTIIPEAQRTLQVDQESYADGSVEFDRTIRDFRTVLDLELGYHQARGRLATALARLCQATGVELEVPSTGELAL